MRCLVCDKNDWENVDRFRLKQEGMSLCKFCGFVSYPAKWQEKEKVLEFYRKQYRAAPTVDNLYQGQRKLNYHAEFLNAPVIDVWKQAKKEDPVICDIGAAYGLVLGWFKKLFPKADLNGTELTLSYRRNAYHEFGVELTEDFDESKTYDFISSYKVAEHMLDVDLELKRYRFALKPDGFLYISVPTWFNRLHNFGATGFSIEYYYAPAHVNVWTREHFEALLKKVGFKIILENHAYYDDTYLCIPCEPEAVKFESLPSPDKIKEWMEKIKIADECCQKKNFQAAIDYWPNFPVARRALYEYHRKELHDSGIEEIIAKIVKPWIELDPDSNEAWTLGADLYMRYGQYEKGLRYLKEALTRKPKCEAILTAIGNCYRELAKRCNDADQSVRYTIDARNIMRFLKDSNLSAFGTGTTWIYNDNANIPMPCEVKRNVDSKS